MIKIFEELFAVFDQIKRAGKTIIYLFSILFMKHLLLWI